METKQKDNALRRAISQAQEQPMRLPSNFAYQTLQRVRRERLARERRERRLSIAAVIAVALLGIGTILYLFGQAIVTSVRESSWTILPTLFCMSFLAALNSILHRRFRNTSRT